MPTFDWQLIVALLAVAAAASFLVRRALSLLQSGDKAGGACGSCGSCSTKTSAGSPTPFIPLESLSLRLDNESRLSEQQRDGETNSTV